ncbi:hypothetical protein B0H15DRAFT_460799 [Mycena belliarum]|uniref:Uncharacterized protein n=1 Tax=Mycena belliarum TaxID=1033014 RepID=A0AAD6XUI4_9AGAR|nr:hypothetical protein B0H15DRAFT_460799 [Mycena belliae]
MGQEIELLVTIKYGGAKRRIATVDEALPVVLEDLNALGIPHPKRAGVKIVFPGTVRFFWIALPRSSIHNTLISGIRPTSKARQSELRSLLDKLSIEDIHLREAPAPPDARPNPVPPQPTWKPYEHMNPPDAGLYALPMSGPRGGSGFQPHPHPGWSQNHQPEHAKQFIERIASGEAPRAQFDSFGSSSQPRYQNQPVHVKTEPVADMPIPPPTHHSQYTDGDDSDMQIDSPAPRRSSTSTPSLRINRNRYATIPDPNPRPAPAGTEMHALQTELREVRAQLSSEIAKERVILQTLRDLGVEDDSLAATADMDFVTTARIQQIEDELQEERARRRRLEDFVGDIRRECRAPFVVPALLDAFIEISRLTNETLENR